MNWEINFLIEEREKNYFRDENICAEKGNLFIGSIVGGRAGSPGAVGRWRDLGEGYRKSGGKMQRIFSYFKKKLHAGKRRSFSLTFSGDCLCPKPTGQNYFVKNFHGVVGGRISIRVNKAFARWPGNSNNIASKGKCFSILNSPLKTSLLKHNLSVN